MGAGPYFSVVIPVRDRSAQLRRALESVASQTEAEFEIVVVDDGSSLSEAEAISSLVRGTDRAKLVRNPAALGAPRSRNIGVGASSGRVIALLDSDDWWTVDRLAAHRAALGEDPRGMMSYNIARFTNVDDDDLGLTNREAPDPRVSNAVWIAASNGAGGCSSVCVERTAFEAVGGFAAGLPSCQDWDLWFRLVGAGTEVRFVSSVLTMQDCGVHERISNQRAKVLQGHSVVMNAILEHDWDRAARRYIEGRHLGVQAWISQSFDDDLRAFYLSLKSLFSLRDIAALKSTAKYAKRAARGYRATARSA